MATVVAATGTKKTNNKRRNNKGSVQTSPYRKTKKRTGRWELGHNTAPLPSRFGGTKEARFPCNPCPSINEFLPFLSSPFRYRPTYGDHSIHLQFLPVPGDLVLEVLPGQRMIAPHYGPSCCHNSVPTPIPHQALPLLADFYFRFPFQAFLLAVP